MLKKGIAKHQDLKFLEVEENNLIHLHNWGITNIKNKDKRPFAGQREDVWLC